MAPTDCRLHISVTPYQPQVVPEGLRATEEFDPAMLERCQWPRTSGGRCPEGGCGGQIVAEQLSVTWQDDKLIFPISSDPKPLAEKVNNYGLEILYSGKFIAQLDGQVAYVPSTVGTSTNCHGTNGTLAGGSRPGFYLILVESPVAEIQAVRFSSHQAVIVDPFVKHSMPIPFDGSFDFSVFHRNVNAVVQLDPDPAGISPIIINLNKVDRWTPIAVNRVQPHQGHKSKDKGVQKLSKHFAKELLPLEEVTPDSLSPYGRVIPDFACHVEQVSELPWPGVENTDGMAGTLEQDFLVNWLYSPDLENPNLAGIMELEFEGLNGSFAGEKGRPGVEYNPELGIYRANTLMARADGSFYLQPSQYSDVYAMVFALPSPETGNPLEDTLRVFTFRNGNALRLEPRVWHSVPIPLVGSSPQGILFREVVAATNANLVVNVRAEAGHPIQFVQGA
ncbi:hypothetical protein DdX_10932 [Ditylenchus destructor]|uniref:Uncharacterized protein n=1 Tax=Ditylenchus destructor TaxID=166010 RepID=A0AAD4N0X1_9BILA|nr:hypothetical protein DdX_10932 [Ditylenchus destructor]